jgi:hypothetical protein
VRGREGIHRFRPRRIVVDQEDLRDLSARVSVLVARYVPAVWKRDIYERQVARRPFDGRHIDRSVGTQADMKFA